MSEKQDLIFVFWFLSVSSVSSSVHSVVEKPFTTECTEQDRNTEFTETKTQKDDFWTTLRFKKEKT